MHDQLFIVGVALAVAVLVSRALAPRLNLPDALFLVLFGVAASFVPGLPALRLNPDVVFLVLLPPLLYHAGYFASLREAKENAAAIVGLAVGATTVTIAAVALVAALLIRDVGWAAAIALGAAVAPTDAVAATAVLRQLGAPARIVTILEGESLVNDAAALTIFGLAIGFAGFDFSSTRDLLNIVEYVAVYVGGGIAYGLVTGVLIAWLRRQVRDPNTQIIISLVTPYLAYLPAEQVHASGVLATVTAAVYLGSRAHRLLEPGSRLQVTTFWTVLAFLLESGLFFLLGLQLRAIVDGVEGNYSIPTLILDATVVLVVVVGVRLLWLAFVPPLAARASPLRALTRTGMLTLSRAQRFVVGWSGLRGAISLAIVLSIPYTLHGEPFPYRKLLIFITAVVVFATLIGGTLTLPMLLRRLEVAASAQERAEGALARRHTVQTALSWLDRADAHGEVETNTARALRQLFQMRLDRLRVQLGESDTDVDDLPDTRRLWMEILSHQRLELQRLHDEGHIGAKTLHEVGREIDADETRHIPRT